MATDLSKHIDVEALEHASNMRATDNDLKGEGPTTFEGMSQEEMNFLERKCESAHF